MTKDEVRTIQRGDTVHVQGTVEAVRSPFVRLRFDGGAATDVIAPLAAMVLWLRNEATMVNIPEGSYAWAVKLCEQAEMLAGQIGCIEMRAAS